MLEILCDLILSTGTKATHKPLLGQLKLLPSHYITFINTYISTRYTEFLSVDNNNTKNSIDVTSSLESLLFFSEFRSCTTPCFTPLLSYVVDLLEESVDRALHAVGECGAVGWQSIQAVNERVCVVYAMLRDCSTSTAGMITNKNSTITSCTEKVDRDTIEVNDNNDDDGTTTSITAHEEVVLEEKEESEEQLAAVVCRASDCLFLVMKQGTLPKECMASSAVALCTAFTLPSVECSAIAADLVAGLLTDSSIFSPSPESPPPQGWVGSYLATTKKSSLQAELQKLGPISALCLLRGFLQSTSTADLVGAVFLPPATTSPATATAASPWNFLTDGVVCTLCNAMDSSVAIKFKSTALQTLLICVDHLIAQWKPQANNGTRSGDKKNKKEKKRKKDKTVGSDEVVSLSVDSSSGVPFSNNNKVLLTASQQQLMLRVLWQSWDDTQVNAWRVAYQQFGQLITLVGLQDSAGIITKKQQSSINNNKGDFFVSVAKDLLALGPEQKRRYSPLAALVPHLGAGKLLSLHPNLVAEVLEAIAYNAALASPATLMLSVLWSKLHEETFIDSASDVAAAGTNDGANEKLWQGYWVPQVTEALCSTDEAARKAACDYAVPAVAAIDSKALEILFCEVAVTATSDTLPAAMVGLLSVGRKLNLLQDLHAFCASATANTSAAGTAAAPSVAVDLSALLHQAVTHSSDALRSAALQLVCVHPRTTALPTAEELELVQEALNMDLHTTSSSIRQNMIPPLGRLLARIRIASAAILGRPKDFSVESVEEVRRCEAWLQRFSAGVVANAYPRAQYARKYIAVDILCMLLEVYGDLLPLPTTSTHNIASEEGGDQLRKPAARSKSSFRRKGPLAALRKGDGAAGAGLKSDLFQPFSEDFYQPAIVNMLLGCVIDSWDKVRESAAEALLLLPAPLPGLDTPKQVQALLKWGLRLSSSPKLKNADAGARILLLVFQHFVVGAQGWRVGVHPAVVYQSKATHSGAGSNAILDFLATMVGLISSRIDAGEADLTAASKESLAHGPLLALRYVGKFYFQCF